MKNNKQKKIKNKKSGLYNWLCKKSPLDRKTTRNLLILIIIFNFGISTVLAFKLIEETKKTDQLAKAFQERVNNTRSN